MEYDNDGTIYEIKEEIGKLLSCLLYTSRNPDTLYLRKARKIYRPNGTLYMTLAAGKRVKIRTQSGQPNAAGQTMNWLMIIDSYETTSGNYSKIDGGHGFIDMGLTDTGSGYQYIPVYGSW